MSKKNSDSNTYGWARAEVVGALVNAVFLVALCFTIFIEAIQRLTHSHKIDKVDSMIIVGVVGLVVNVVGIVLFYNYGQVQSSEEDSASELEEQTQQPERGNQLSLEKLSVIWPTRDTRASHCNHTVSPPGECL